MPGGSTESVSRYCAILHGTIRRFQLASGVGLRSGVVMNVGQAYGGAPAALERGPR